MGVIQRVVKPKTHRGKRELTKREPKLIEDARNSICIRGNKCSDTTLKFLKDVTKLQKPNSVFFSRKHDFLPFESTTELGRICKKYDASLFVFGSHNKKRPNNIVLGRLFDNNILDMVELGIEKYKGLDEFKTPKFAVGSKPCLIFAGEPFITPSSDYFRLKNIFVDFFRGEEVTNIRVEGLEHVLSFVAVDEKILLRGYKITYKKSGEKTPYVELEEMGPSVDFVLRRTKLAPIDIFKSACKKPKELKPKKKKNITKDVFGSTLGRVHIPKQNLRNLPTRNMKGLKKTMAEKKLERAEKARQGGTDSSTPVEIVSNSPPANQNPSNTMTSSVFVNTSRGPKSDVGKVANAQSGSIQLHLSG
ncbi:Ribosome production factor 2 [Orchesella cincta]|uniref:Ribosome production factor 2 homolog n=1 Tax=Orchesella cincta TaxID=48709 RepID=A0A1D2M748_ORCCI|nr:Ribosome production factor 2 [Orchesella cincta]